MGGGTSEVVVTGPDSLWDNTTGRLSVNQGTLTVADGGTVTSQGGDIGELMGMDAVTVTVTGSDSLWDNTTGRLSVNLRSEEHTSELQSLMRNSYAVFCLKKKKQNTNERTTQNNKSYETR